jgi:ketosteroid isomerase-like protein
LGILSAVSQENIDLVRRFEEQFAQTGEPAWAGLHPDIVVVDHDIPDAGDYSGHEGVSRWLETWASAWESFEMENESYLDADDKVVSLFAMTATGKGSGIEIERKDAIVYTLDDGLVTRLEYFNNQAMALAAADLSPTDVE